MWEKCWRIAIPGGGIAGGKQDSSKEKLQSGGCIAVSRKRGQYICKTECVKQYSRWENAVEITIPWSGIAGGKQYSSKETTAKEGAEWQ